MKRLYVFDDEKRKVKKEIFFFFYVTLYYTKRAGIRGSEARAGLWGEKCEIWNMKYEMRKGGLLGLNV